MPSASQRKNRKPDQVKTDIWSSVFDIRPPSQELKTLTKIVDLALSRVGGAPRARARTSHQSRRETLTPVRKRGFTKALLAWSARATIGISIITIAFLSWHGVSQMGSREKEKVMAVLEVAVGRMEDGESSLEKLDFVEAKRAFKEASMHIRFLKEELGVKYAVLLRFAGLFPFDSRLGQTSFLFDVFSRFPERAAMFTELLERFQTALPDIVFGNTVDGRELVADIENELAGLSRDLKKMNKAVERSKTLSQKIPVFANALENKREMFKVVRQILSFDGEKAYLVLFQNPAEIRATGGFVGSYGVLRIRNGKIQEFKVDDIYNPDGQLQRKVVPPRPLLRITRSWGARDANWFFDFADSAKKVSEFLYDTTRLNPDAVIAVNPEIVMRLLEFTGPVEMPEYEKVVTAQNLWEEMQYQTRVGVDRTQGQPKRFLSIFGPRLLEKVRSIPARQWPELASAFSQALNEKEIQLYFRDQGTQQFVESRGWGGRVREARDMDYLAVVHTNIGGGKADYVTTQNVDLAVKIGHDGSITNTLTVKRIHNGNNAKYWWWRARNYDYVRLYVPRGAELLESRGAMSEPTLLSVDRERYQIDPDLGLLANVRPVLVEPGKHVEVFEEGDKTVFAGWMITEPGESSSFTISYRLPFSVGYASPGYGALVQKQSGVESGFRHTLVLPEGTEILKTSEGFDGDTSAWVIDELKTDVVHSAEFKFPKL
ncbi:MAG: DUF4012 domain-containing protein [Parcubacteria group bacterium]|nr:DUF4012 domain-containing protein [Parcubacteria group bacterium]